MPTYYQIRVKGHLSDSWTDWFDGLVLARVDGGETLIHGPIADQAALYGVLVKVRDLGLTLIDVRQMADERPPQQ